jgi:hypothetical protein
VSRAGLTATIVYLYAAFAYQVLAVAVHFGFGSPLKPGFSSIEVSRGLLCLVAAIGLTMRCNWARVFAITVSFAYVLWLILYLALAFMGDAELPSGAVNYVLVAVTVTFNVLIILYLLGDDPVKVKRQSVLGTQDYD